MGLNQLGNATIFAVDDAESVRRILVASFANVCQFEVFETADLCLQRIVDRKPDLLLLDVELPGMDGYALCREVKALPGLTDIPVIFISALDDLESCLAGYDAGGIDFIVKPYKLEELKQKILLALTAAAAKAEIRRQAEDSELLASLIMSNMDEYALLIRFLRGLSSCETLTHVAEALFSMLSAFRLEGVVQFRTVDGELTLNRDGESSPIEVSVIQNLRGMGSVFEFRSRAAFNFPLITVLVNNMPSSDAELCGRLRDHLAIAVESANARIEAIDNRAAREKAVEGIASLLRKLELTVDAFGRSYDKARSEGSIVTKAMLDDLMLSFAHLGLSEGQEESIVNVVRRRAFDLAEVYDFSDQTGQALSEIESELIGLLKAFGR